MMALRRPQKDSTNLILLLTLHDNPGAGVLVSCKPGITPIPYIVRNRKCHVTLTAVWTKADAKIEPLLRHVQP